MDYTGEDPLARRLMLAARDRFTVPFRLVQAMSVRRLRLPVLLTGLVVLCSIGAVDVHAQPDSVRAEILKKKGFSPDHSPTGALWRSAAVPGWGQYYNRQHYKIPFVYAGLAALGYRMYTSQQEYLLFKRAHLFGRREELPGDYAQYEPQFNEVTNRLGTDRLSLMRSQRDQFRRRRNLAVLGAGLLYALNVLDAYVSAHLLTFDVGESLNLRVRPIGRLRSPHRPHEQPGRGPRSASALRWTEAHVERGAGLQFRLQFY